MRIPSIQNIARKLLRQPINGKAMNGAGGRRVYEGVQFLCAEDAGPGAGQLQPGDPGLL